MATRKKIMFGVHAARAGEKLPFVLKMVEKRSVKINRAAMIIPIAR